jgi:hypothetical protein
LADEAHTGTASARRQALALLEDGVRRSGLLLRLGLPEAVASLGATAQEAILRPALTARDFRLRNWAGRQLVASGDREAERLLWETATSGNGREPVGARTFRGP